MTFLADRDPTGTADLLRAFERELKDRWQRLDRCLNKAVGISDALGLSPIGALSLIPAADRMKHFRSWLDELLSHLIVSGGGWMQTYLDEAGRRASSRADSLDPRKAAGGGLPTAPRIAGHTEDAILVLATSELQGICDAVSQQVSRLVSHCLLTRARPQQAARGIRQLIATVGLQRSRMMADYLIVKAHACATLVAFREAGVTHVGTVAEMVPHEAWSLNNNKTAETPNLSRSTSVDKTASKEGVDGEKPTETKDSTAVDQVSAPTAWGYQISEEINPRHDELTDAARKTRQHQHPRTGKFITKTAATREWGRRASGKFGTAPKVFNRSLKHRKALRGMGAAGEEEVNIQTAGDDRVCQACQNVAAAGPYPINEAMNLIPLHPRCRCVFIPASLDEGGSNLT